MSNSSERVAVVIGEASGIGWAHLKRYPDVMGHVMRLVDSQ
jgi:hypothetical protein